VDYVGIKIERLGEEGGGKGPYEAFYSWAVLGKEALNRIVLERGESASG